LLLSGFREKSDMRDERPSLWWGWLRFTVEASYSRTLISLKMS